MTNMEQRHQQELHEIQVDAYKLAIEAVGGVALTMTHTQVAPLVTRLQNIKTEQEAALGMSGTAGDRQKIDDDYNSRLLYLESIIINSGGSTKKDSYDKVKPHGNLKIDAIHAKTNSDRSIRSYETHRPTTYTALDLSADPSAHIFSLITDPTTGLNTVRAALENQADAMNAYNTENANLAGMLGDTKLFPDQTNIPTDKKIKAKSRLTDPSDPTSARRPLTDAEKKNAYEIRTKLTELHGELVALNADATATNEQKKQKLDAMQQEVVKYYQEFGSLDDTERTSLDAYTPPDPPPPSPEADPVKDLGQHGFIELRDKLVGLRGLQDGKYDAVAWWLDDTINDRDANRPRYADDSEVKKLVDEVKKHRATGHDPFESADKKYNKRYEMSAKEKKQRRMGRAALVSYYLTHAEVEGRDTNGNRVRSYDKMREGYDKYDGKTPHHFSAFMTKLFVRFGAEKETEWSKRLGARMDLFEQEKNTLADERRERRENVAKSREFIHTDVGVPAGGALWNKAKGDPGDRNYQSANGLIFNDDKNADDSERGDWSVDELALDAGRGEKFLEEQEDGWHRGEYDPNVSKNSIHHKEFGKKKFEEDELTYSEDSFFRSDKLYNDAMAQALKIDPEQNEHGIAHEATGELAQQATHNVRLQAMLTTALLRTNYGGEDPTSFADVPSDQIQATMDQLKFAVNLDKITKSFNEHIAELQRVMKVESGALWEKYEARFREVDDRGERRNRIYAAIKQKIADFQEALDRLNKKSDEAKAEWQKQHKQLTDILEEREFTMTTRDAEGDRPAETRRANYTFKAFKRSELLAAPYNLPADFDAQQWQYKYPRAQQDDGTYDGGFNYSNVPDGVEHDDNDVYLEVTIHIADADGRFADNARQHENGRLVGYIDTRTGSLVGATGEGDDNDNSDVDLVLDTKT